MQLFYCKDITPEGYCTLDAEESRHAVRVLRLRNGDSINVTDGRGSLYSCTIVDANDRTCTIEVISQLTTPISHLPSLHLAIAPTKNPSRMEWLVEKAVEVGVGEITLLNCDHSERSFLKTDRLEKLAVSAMKQSLHTVLPAINPAVNLREWLATGQYPLNAQKLIAHCEADKPRTPMASALKPGVDTIVLIGPEGDFSEDEIALALEKGFTPVSLGPSRLRTETAALYAVCAFNLINDR
jgi:16S rRNA (uracil1498-N3)-methyltransferase